MSTRREAGFTIVELVAGMTAAVVLALTLGAMVVYSYRGWKNMQAVAELERDGSLAMSTMRRVIRGASSSQVSVGSMVIVSNVNSIAAQSFYLAGSRLVYASNGTPRMDLVQTGVTGFASASASNTVTVVLSLGNAAANATMSMSNTITLRN